VPYPTDLYAPPLGLLTDLYQLTMAFAAFKAGIADRQVEAERDQGSHLPGRQAGQDRC